MELVDRLLDKGVELSWTFTSIDNNVIDALVVVGAVVVLAYFAYVVYKGKKK